MKESILAKFLNENRKVHDFREKKIFIMQYTYMADNNYDIDDPFTKPVNEELNFQPKFHFLYFISFNFMQYYNQQPKNS